MMLLHGDADTLAPVEESRRLAEALRRDSREPVVYLELPGAPHAFELFPSLRSVAAIEGVAEFCQRLWVRHQRCSKPRAKPALTTA
jgi:acetyl esterase/lipase